MVRASLLTAGLWLGFLVASWVVATLSFKSADRVAGPEPAEDRRMVLRHLAAGINPGLSVLLLRRP